MIKRLKENENLRKMNYFKAKDNYTKSAGSFNVDHKVATEKVREEIRDRVKADGVRDRKRLVLVLILSVFATFTLILAVMVLLSL